MPRRWLVTGACGKLGGHVLRELGGEDVVAVGRRACSACVGGVRALDVSDAERLCSALERVAPTHIVHLAAESSPAAATRRPEAASTMNVLVARWLAEYAGRTGAWLAYPSTDFVFDGVSRRRYREDDPVHPLGHYARTKVDGEHEVLQRHVGAVARLSLTVGAPVCRRPTWWGLVVDRMLRGESVPAAVDEYRSPLTMRDAARAIVGMGRRRFRGLMHVAGPEVMTPFEMVRSLAAGIGVEPKLQPISRLALGGGTERPGFVPLEVSRLHTFDPDLVPRRVPWSTVAVAVSEDSGEHRQERTCRP